MDINNELSEMANNASGAWFKADSGNYKVAVLKERGMPVPPPLKNPKIIVQNEEKLAA